MSHQMSVEPTGPVTILARRVRDLRNGKGWTAAQLGDALTDEGVTWDRFTVANLENGKRQNVSVRELLALAYVLDVPVMFLLMPDGSRPLKVTKRAALYAPEALEFMTGADMPPTWMHRNPDAVRRWVHATGLLRLLKRFKRAWSAADEETVSENLAAVVNEMVENGVYPAPIAAPIVKDMQTHGFRYADQIHVESGPGDGPR